ncbi:1837_t:CDS:2, partial [Gigaspora margarita]
LMKKKEFFEINANKSKSSIKKEESEETHGSTTLAGSEVKTYEVVTAKVLAVNLVALVEKLGDTFEDHKKDIMKLSEDYKKDIMKLSEDHKKDTMKLAEDHKKDTMKLSENIMKLSEDHKKDTMKLSEEKFALSEEKYKLMIRKKKEEFELHNCTARIFKLERISNIRGALEYIREQAKYLREMCKLNDVHLKAMKKCLAGLYHISSKALHSHTNEIEICAKDWETNKVIALDVIFKFFHINFIHLDEHEKETEYPYKIGSV